MASLRLTQYQRGQRRGKVLQPVHASPRGLSGGFGQRTNQAEAGAGKGRRETERRAIGADPGAGEAVPGWPRRSWVAPHRPGDAVLAGDGEESLGEPTRP